MTFEEMQRLMQLILEQQAQFGVDMDCLLQSAHCIIPCRVDERRRSATGRTA